MKIETQNYSHVIGRLCTEPFLAVGMFLFWTSALPAAALFFSAVRLVDHVRAFITAPAPVGARLVRHTA